MTLELFRHRWTYSVLVTLLEGPLASGQLLRRINEGVARNAELVGTHVLSPSVFLPRLRQMEAEGLLLARRPGNGDEQKELTLAGEQLLRSTYAISAWATAQKEHLALALRTECRLRGADLVELPANQQVLTPEQERWRRTGMTLRVLRPRWAFAILVQLSHGPQQPTGVTEAVNAGVDRNRDLTGSRSLSEKMFWETLHRLVDAGLVVHRPRPRQIASTARCVLTPAGHELLNALAPVGEWAIKYEEELLLIVRRRRGLSNADEY